MTAPDAPLRSCRRCRCTSCRRRRAARYGAQRTTRPCAVDAIVPLPSLLMSLCPLFQRDGLGPLAALMPSLSATQVRHWPDRPALAHRGDPPPAGKHVRYASPALAPPRPPPSPPCSPPSAPFFASLVCGLHLVATRLSCRFHAGLRFRCTSARGFCADFARGFADGGAPSAK